MPYSGNGQFSRLYSWIQDKANGIFIDSTRMDNEMNGMATGLSTAICKDGQTTLTADIPWNGKKITGYGTTNTPSARSDVPQMGQAQDATLNWVAAGGTADAITAAYAPPITALINGQECTFRASAANATATPTFSPSGLTARTIVKRGGAALVVGDIPGNLAEVTLRYNLANTRWEMVNASQAVEGSWTPTLAGDSTPGTQTYSTQIGRYIRQGNLVTAWFTLVMTAKDAATAGNIIIAGLPFQSSNVTGLNGVGAIAQWGQITLTSNAYSQVGATLSPASTQALLVQSGGGQAPASISVAGLAATSSIVGVITYRIN